jgi:hypothetical protein
MAKKSVKVGVAVQEGEATGPERGFDEAAASNCSRVSERIALLPIESEKEGSSGNMPTRDSNPCADISREITACIAKNSPRSGRKGKSRLPWYVIPTPKLYSRTILAKISILRES